MVTSTVDKETLDEIIRLKEALDRSEDAASSDEDHVGDAYSNRGRKLKRGANQIYEGKLGGAPFDRHGIKTVEYAGRKRAVVYKKRKTAYPEATEGLNGEQTEDSDSESDSDVYKDIKLADLLAPINHPSEVPSHPAISRAFKNKTIRVLARHAMEVINEEQKHAVQFARLMSVFLGDDPAYRRSNMLSLPIYNHLDGLKDPSEEGNASKKDGEANGGTASQIKDEEQLSQGRRPSTRNQVASSSQETDSFFALPQFSIDRDYGIRPEEAEDTRQLTQIAQQRSEEFVRCMTKVRFGLLRAEKYQAKVYKWCQEMAGVEDDSDGNEQPISATSKSNSSSSREDNKK